MVQLVTQFAGISFPNPFILSSGPPTANGAMIKAAFDAGWGGAVLKTVAGDPTPLPKPRVFTLRRGKTQRGMVNIELFTDMSVERWKHDLDLVRAAHPTRPVIASVMGGNNAREWTDVMNALEPHGVTAFELNVSCPNISGKKGAQLGQDPEAMAKVIRWAKEATSLPILVKLTPNVSDITVLALAAKEAGADVLVSTNTISGLAGIDLETLSPLPSVVDHGIFGGYSGPGLKPVSLRCTARIAQTVKIPLVGCGGIETWQDAAEYIAVGAQAVQMCTSVMWRGSELIHELTRGLQQYLERHGYQSVADLSGKALPRLVKFDDLDLSVKLLAHVDEDICNGCGICIKACASGGYQAIVMKDGVAEVNTTKCDGCGLCVGVCPTDAIKMEKA